MGAAEYADAVYVIPPITFGVFLTAIYGQFVNVEFFYHYNKFAAAASVIAATSNVALNYVCISQFGYMAAGYTTFASYLLLAVMHFFGLKNISARNGHTYKDVFDLKVVLMIVFGFAISVTIIFFTYNYIWLRMTLLLLLLLMVLIERKKITSFAGQFLRKG